MFCYRWMMITYYIRMRITQKERSKRNIWPENRNSQKLTHTKATNFYNQWSFCMFASYFYICWNRNRLVFTLFFICSFHVFSMFQAPAYVPRTHNDFILFMNRRAEEETTLISYSQLFEMVENEKKKEEFSCCRFYLTVPIAAISKWIVKNKRNGRDFSIKIRVQSIMPSTSKSAINSVLSYGPNTTQISLTLNDSTRQIYKIHNQMCFFFVDFQSSWYFDFKC